MLPDRNPTFRDLLDRLATDDALSDQRRRHLSCSLRNIAKALERRPEDLPAQWAAVRSRIDDIHPSAVGWTGRTAANHKSNARAALSWFEIDNPAPKRGAPLTSDWIALWQSIADGRLRTRLSSLIKYLSAQGIAPDQTGEAELDAFMTYRAQHTRLDFRVAERRRVVRAWNTCSTQVRGWPKNHLIVPPDGRSNGPVWEDFPETLRAEVDVLFETVSRRRKLANGTRTRAWTDKTIRTRRRELIAYARKAVSVGYPIENLTSLSILLDPTLVEKITNAYWDANGSAPKTYTLDLPWRMSVLAKNAGCLDQEQLDELADQRAACNSQRGRGLTEKNRQVIRAVKSTDVWARVCRLPWQLMEEARRQRSNSPRKAALKAQLAVAIAILCVAPVRIGNLVSTRLDDHLIRIGGPKGRFWLKYAAHEVKNKVSLDFPLDDDLTALITEYLERHRLVLMKSTSEPWLFPGQPGRAKASHLLSAQIRNLVEKRTGLRVTAHQFRHVAGAMLLIKFPGNYALVAKVLAHKGTDTTMKSYVGLDGIEATELFGILVKELRISGPKI
jgi:hypothetical protein